MVQEKGERPTFVAFKRHMREVITGKPVGKVGKKSKAQIAREKKDRELKAALSDQTKSLMKDQERLDNVLPIGQKTWETSIDPACMIAFLVLFGAEDGYNTTYTKVRRYLYKDKQAVVNPREIDPKTEESLYTGPKDQPLDTLDAECWPKDTYEGVGFDAHVLWPMVAAGEREEATEVLDEKTGVKTLVKKIVPTFVSRAMHHKYKDRQFVGVTREFAKEHYLRFFGDNNGIKTPVDDHTGRPIVKEDGTNEDVKTERKVEITGANILELLAGTKTALAKITKANVTPAVKEEMMNLYRDLDAKIREIDPDMDALDLLDDGDETETGDEPIADVA